MSSKDSLRRQFDEIDTDHDGYIAADEFKAYLQKNPKVSDANARAALDYADENSDEQISFEEFSKFVR
ncbi:MULTISPECIES: EF-hand domain-containing protein [Kitasatospora]|uniref:EF-hand domain-containing protein n=1 Tax=Kitasatospora cystarginea TaxID=58350 RepID=A0ABN3DI19_9ACTN